MWFIGMIFGLLIGAASEGIWGAAFGMFLGALFGAGVGFLFRKASGTDAQTNKPSRAAPSGTKVNSDARLDMLQRSLEDIHWRLKRLEDAQGFAGSPMQDSTSDTAPATSAANKVVFMPPPSQPASSAAELQSLNEAAETLSAATKSMGEVAPAPAPAPAREAATQRPPTPPRAPAKPKEPSKPNPIVAWFMGGNTIVRIGVVILFFGLTFLVKYAAEAGFFPIEFRLAGVAATAIALMVVGWRLRGRADRKGYALTLQGAGVAILYLTIFTAFRMEILGAGIAFPLLVGVAAFSALLAMRQDAMSLAVIGSAGGFLAPILASTGGGSHIALFSYYAILNAGIFVVAWKKAWRPLNIVGFVFTFVIGLAWGAKYYKPEFYSSVQGFVILFFVMYLGIALLYAFRQAPKLTDYVDGTLIFGVPIVGFGMQAGLLKDTEFGLAFSALALAFVYLLLATWLHAKKRDSLALLTQSFQALGIIFGSLAIPLALDARWTSAAWALEGAAIYWVGVRQDRRLARAFGILMFVLANVAFMHGWRPEIDALLVFNRQCIGALLLALSAWFINRVIHKHAATVSELERQVVPAFFFIGLAWWLVGGLGEIEAFVQAQAVDTFANGVTGYRKFMFGFLFIALTGVAFAWLSESWKWREAGWPELALIPLLVLLSVGAALDLGAVLHETYGAIAYVLAFLLCGILLRRLTVYLDEQAAQLTLYTGYLSLLNTLFALLVVFVVSVELWNLAKQMHLNRTGWSLAAVALPSIAMLLWLGSSTQIQKWGVKVFPKAYLLRAAGVSIFFLAAWSFFSSIAHSGASSPLPYLPLLNPVDLATIFAAFAIVFWWRKAKPHWSAEGQSSALAAAKIVLPALAFMWANAILLRTIHHYFDVPYNIDSLASSTLVQASISIFWTVLALGMTWFASRKGNRVVWIVGGALLAVVVAKMMFIDLGGLSGLARIVAFIVVGALMLVVGYISPIPPSSAARARRNETENENENPIQNEAENNANKV